MKDNAVSQIPDSKTFHDVGDNTNIGENNMSSLSPAGLSRHSRARLSIKHTLFFYYINLIILLILDKLICTQSTIF